MVHRRMLKMKRGFLLLLFCMLLLIEIDFISATVNVTSVQYYYFNLPVSTDSKYLPFIGGQTNSNIVPFATQSVNDTGTTNDYFSRELFDVYFNSTGVIINRSLSTSATINASIYAVQFGTGSVRVQSGNLSLDSATQDWNYQVIPTAVNLSRAALVFYYASTDATDDYSDNSVRGSFVNTTYLNFSADPLATTGVKRGVWYVFESLDGQFTVQNVSLDMVGGDTLEAGTISSVNTSKTFLISSYSSGENDDDPRDGMLNVSLNNETSILLSRSASNAGGINTTIFAVTFLENETVQRGNLSYAAGSSPLGPQIAVAVINTVNTSMSMAWGPVLVGRSINSASTAQGRYGAYHLLNLTNSTGVTGSRCNSTGAAVGNWEVVQWAKPSFGINWSSNSTNSTTAGQAVLHNVLWNAGSGVSGYIFSFDNGNGTFYNDTWTPMTVIPSWSNVTKVANSTANSTIRWRVYANDSSNVLNVTSTFQYTVTGVADSCTCTDGASWTIINGDQCTLTSTCNLGTNPVRIMSGALRISSTGILNAQGCFVRDYQDLYVINGGKLSCRS
jgi:hypothetical protein